MNGHQAGGHYELDTLQHRIGLLLLLGEGLQQKRSLGLLPDDGHVHAGAGQIEDQRQAGGVEGHEDHIVDQNREHGKHAQYLQALDARQCAHPHQQYLHNRVQRNGRPKELQTPGDVLGDLGLVATRQSQLGEAAGVGQVDDQQQKEQGVPERVCRKRIWL